MIIRFSFCFNLLKFQNKTNGSSENSLYINHGTLMKIIYNNKSSKYNTNHMHFLFFSHLTENMWQTTNFLI